MRRGTPRAADTSTMRHAAFTTPKAAPRDVLALLFLFGAAQFFVNPEPGLPEFLFPVLLLFTTQSALLAPAHLLLLAGNVAAVIIEFLTMQTITWSLLSLYMTLISIALLSIMTKYEFYACAKALLLGGAFGSAITLAALATPWADQVYRYGIRFTGFFKDPNVTAPTALFFAIALLAVRGRWRWAALIPFTVFAISLSRASYLAAAVAIVYLVAAKNKLFAILGGLGLIAAVLFLDQITLLIDTIFRSVGRQGLINGYDSDRSSNWSELITLSWERSAPLGPGFSEANGMSTHSTYLRLLVEQGVLVLILFVVAMFIAWRSAESVAIRAALLGIAVNGIVVDATHWRVLFIAIAVALAWRKAPETSIPLPRRRRP